MNLSRLKGFVAEGEPLRWPHRIWLGTIFIIGVLYCYAFPPFQTNDEDAHWKHLWGVAYGGLRCNAPKPQAIVDFLNVVEQRAVRENPGAWRIQFQHEALHFVGSKEATTNDGTACRYPPHPYLVPGLVARLVAFGVSGRLGPGSVLRAAYAARITNWILVTLAVLLLCRRLPWMRNFTLAFYSIPEMIQQSMAVNTDSFLFVAAAFLLLLVFGRRMSTWNLIGIAVVVALIAMVKPVYAAFSAFGLIAGERLLAQHRWRVRDLAALAAAVALPIFAQWAWIRWVNVAPPSAGPPPPDRGRAWATQQMQFLAAHKGMVWTLLRHQWRDLFGSDLMKGSWLSIFGAFGWSMFTMARAGHYVLVVGLALSIVDDVITGVPSPGLERPRWRMKVALGVVSLALVAMCIAIIIGMYIYFSGAFLGRIGADEVIGVQGRYYLLPIFFWIVFLIHVARRREPLMRWWAGLPDVLTVASLFLCAWSNVYALREILYRFNSVYLRVPIPAPPHY